MDEVTQQNSALVEENAATAKTLEQQAKAMDERIGVFKIDGSSSVVTPMVKRPAAPVTMKKTVAAPRGARQMQTKLATAVAKDEWEEF